MPNQPPRLRMRRKDEVVPSHDTNTYRGKGKHNSLLLPPMETILNGAERAIIVRALERVPPEVRTQTERNLLSKVR